MIGRRNVLAFLGLGPVAAPAALQDMVSGRTMLGLGAQMADQMEDYNVYDVGDSSETTGDEKAYIRNQIKDAFNDFRDRKAKPLTDYIRNVERLDADLQANRSMSLTAKIRCQAERDRDRILERHHSRMTTIVSSLRKQLWPKETDTTNSTGKGFEPGGMFRRVRSRA